jgi:protein Tob/BTG
LAYGIFLNKGFIIIIIIIIIIRLCIVCSVIRAQLTLISSKHRTISSVKLAIMDVEISVAVAFVCSHLYHNLPRRRVNMFAEELAKGLRTKFSGHWYPETPVKGSAYRCTRLTTADGHLDPVMERAACASGLLLDELACALPRELTIWVDPGEVAQRVGERGYMTTLYSNRQAKNLLHRDVDSFTESAMSRSQVDDQTSWPAIASLISPAISPSASGLPMISATAAFMPEDYVDSQKLSPMSELPSAGTSPHAWSPSRLSPVHATSPQQQHVSQQQAAAALAPMSIICAPSAGPSPQRSNSQTMTAALFAQTKFGSTKLRSQARRPTRLLPAAAGDHPFATAPAAGAFQPHAIHLQLPSQQAGSGHTSPRFVQCLMYNALNNLAIL